MENIPKAYYTFDQYESAKRFMEDFVKCNMENIKRSESIEMLENLKNNVLIMYSYLESIHIDKRLGLFEDSAILKNTLNKIVAIRRIFLIDRDERIISLNKGFICNIPTEAKLCVKIEELIKSLGMLVSLNL